MNKKAYIAPHLSVYGSIAEITSYSFDSSADDTYVLANGDTLPGTGSLDGCVQRNRQCVYHG